MDDKTLYQARSERVSKALVSDEVDQIPVLYMGIAPAARQTGLSMAEFCANPDAALTATLDYMDTLGGVDGINLHPPTHMPWLLSAIWLSHVLIPGRELPPDSLWQVQEAEVMKVDDYDFLIEKGWQAFQGMILPKVMEPADLQAGQEYLFRTIAQTYEAFRNRQYVPLSCGITTIPFEYLCGARSMQQFIFDLYRRPDKVQAAMDVMLSDLIGVGIALPQMSGVPAIWVGGWRAASAMVAPKLWDRFVWPYYYKIATALIEHGVTPIFHWDQDWTRDLGRLKELPAKKCALNPDGMTDLRKLRETLGDHVSIVGDVPSSIFAAGTPDDVYAYVRDLVRDIGYKGLILCPGCDAPINTKPENMKAFVAAAHEYGKVTTSA